jgi:glycerol-3-phosphate dehydrogenase
MEDIIIIGGGVCGCSLLYELSRYKLAVVLLEKENDVACGTSKSNSAIVHAGYDPEPGTDMARFNVEGNALIKCLCADLDIMYKQIGSLVVGFNDEGRASIEKLLKKGNKNGVPGLKIVEGEELFRMEPNLNRDVTCALYAPSAGIICPWELASAQAECAIQGGARVELDCDVTGIRKDGDGFVVQTSKGDYRARFVVNAAGVDSDLVSRMIETNHFTITPKSGEYFVLDTTEIGLVNMTVFPCPSKLGKGVLVSPTVHGNIIVGPDSKDFPRGDFSTTAEGLEYVRKNALRCIPGVNFRASIRNFSGLRANAGLEDFIVGESGEVPGFFNIAAVKSPGLTSAPSIAKEIALRIKNNGIAFEPNPDFVAKRKIKRFHDMSEEERKAAIAENPLYGTIVCRCEMVTEGEIIDALNRPLPPRSVDAVKRRCRPGTGRCQGGFCGPKVLELISKHYGIKPEEVPKDRKGMYIVTGPTKKTGMSAK